MGWAPLPADAHLDNATANAAVPAAPATAAAVPAADPTPAPSGYAPLPADAQLDAPASAPAPQAAASAPAGAADVVNNSTTQGEFRDQEAPGAHQEPLEVKAQVVKILSTHPVETAAQDARDYLAPLGFNAAPSTDPKYADNFDAVVDYRKHYGVVGSSVENLLPPVPNDQPMGAGAASVRGAADSVTAGLLNHVDAGLHAVADTVSGNAPDGFINDFRRHEDINQSILNADEANHPYARLTGQLLGGLAIPSGLEGVGLEAGKSVLVSGGTMREARAAAAAAVRNRLAAEGGAYGAVHGAADNANNPVLGGIEGAATGAVGGYGLAAAGQAAPKIAKTIQDITPEALVASKATDQPNYVQIARDLNISRTPATNSKSGVSTVIQAGLGALPGGTPVAAAARTETGDLANAARAVAESVGPVSTRQGAGEAVAQGAAQYKAASKAEASARYQQRDILVPSEATPINGSRTKSAAASIAESFPEDEDAQALLSHPAVQSITSADAQQPANFGAARSALAHAQDVAARLGAEDANPDVAEAAGSLATALRKDMLDAAHLSPVPTPQAKAALANISSRFPTSPAIQQLREHPAIRAIGGALPGEPTSEEVPTGILDASGKPITRTVTSGGEPLTLGEVTEALSHVRGVVRNLSSQTLNGKATAPVLSRVKQVEQGLENDVTAAARKADVAAGRAPGDPGSAVAAQKQADAFYADRSAALNGALKKPIQSANDDTQVSGESVYNQIYHDMNKDSGNISRLRDTWFRLPDTAKRIFAATAIDDLGRATSSNQNDIGNEWSFNTLLTNRDKLSPQARNIVFGAKADQQLDKISAYASRLRQLDKARNFSNTAQKYFAGAFMAAVIPHIMHGDIGGALETASVLPATWGGAKLLLATPKMRDWTAQAMKAMTLGSTQRETALRILTKKLGSIATADPTIANEASGLQKMILQAVNDNSQIVTKSAASPDANGKHQQQ